PVGVRRCEELRRLVDGVGKYGARSCRAGSRGDNRKSRISGTETEMRQRCVMLALVAAGMPLAITAAWSAKPDAGRGQQVFRACAACHCLEPGRSMTGPSLADLWNRKAGSLTSFPRYSSALTSSGVVWNDKTLDDWIRDPQRLIPGNDMTFQGINNDQQRMDLL